MKQLKSPTWISDITEVIGKTPLYYNDKTGNLRRIKFYAKMSDKKLNDLHKHIQQKRPELSIQVTKIGAPDGPHSHLFQDEVCVYYRPKVLIKKNK